MKELFEILASIPVFNIIKTIFSGEFGWKTPVAFVLQIVLQIVVACMLGMGVGCTIAVAFFLIAFNLLVGLCIGMMVFSEMGPKSQQIYNGPTDYLVKSGIFSLIYGGVLNGAVIGVSMFFATSGFFVPFLLAVIGAAVIHMFGVALPIYQIQVQHANEVGKQDNK
jgi:hypothetical protein